MKTLEAFKNDIKIQMSIYDQIEDWLNKKHELKSPEEIAKEILSLTKKFKPSECILENYEDFPEKLGLPLWLAYLLRTINHYNAADGLIKTRDYRDFFYKRFILTCKLGVDYSKMLHKWQIFILTDDLPANIIKHQLIDKTVDLHLESLTKQVDILHWENLEVELQKEMYNFNEQNSSEYNLLRAAFLSTHEVIDINNIYTSSAEAIVEIKAKKYIKNPKTSPDMSIKIAWRELMDDLLEMIDSWE